MKWMRERLRRGRGKKKSTGSESESTGKIGQEKPSGFQPLVPAYDFEAPPEPSEAAPAPPERETPRREGRESGRREGRESKRGEQREARREEKRDEKRGRLVVEEQPEQPMSPAVDSATTTPQPKGDKGPKGIVVLAIGLPGSGKTTWFKRRGVTPLSSDMLRTILFDNITEQRYQGLVFSTLRSLLRARLIAKMTWNYVDATNLSPQERKQWIKMAKSFGYDVHAVYFDVPLELCLERNRRRERQVNEEVMHRMAQKLRPPKFEEGFGKIIVVRVKSKKE